MKLRNLSDDEQRLLTGLLARANESEYDILNLQAEPLNDGDMGSIRLWSDQSLDVDREFAGKISELMFTDQDGIQVIASLYVDKKQALFEIDVWKTDFEKVIKIPEEFKSEADLLHRCVGEVQLRE